MSTSFAVGMLIGYAVFMLVLVVAGWFFCRDGW